ncbi:MAG: AI-2E family transporter [Lachnospiraceae bacterium]|nr:AI-2E family transporter [Lachnospiraceae bacterium]
MKWKPDKNQVRWGVTLFVVAAAVLLFYYILFHGYKVTGGIKSMIASMMSITYGIVIAYILSPVMNFFEKRCFGRHYEKKGIDLKSPEGEKYRRRARNWSVTLTMLFFLLIILALLLVIIPQIVRSVRSIIVSFPTYANNIMKMTNTYLADNPEIASTINQYLGQMTAQITGFVNNTLIPQATTFLRRISQSLVAFVMGMFNFIIGIIVAIYLLNGKEGFKSGAKKLTYALFKEKTANELISGARYAHYTFSGFIVGKLFDSLIIGILCYIGAVILKTPYPVLMSVIVGVTNIIPFFGPYIGEFMTFLLLLLINPPAAVVFLIFVFVLQQFDGNILGPKILGGSTGLSAFWVIFSVLFFGSIFGVIGWVLGVPLFAVFYALVGRIEDHLLRKKKLPTEKEVYGETAYVEKGTLVHRNDADWDLYHVRHPQSVWKRIFGIRREMGQLAENRLHRSSTDRARESADTETPNTKDNGDA